MRPLYKIKAKDCCIWKSYRSQDICCIESMPICVKHLASCKLCQFHWHG